MLFFWFLVICKYSLSVFNFVFQKCWYHGCIHAPSGCQMSIDFFAFGGCENWTWSTHSKWNFFFIFAKWIVWKTCASWRCLVIEQLLRVEHKFLVSSFQAQAMMRKNGIEFFFISSLFIRDLFPYFCYLLLGWWIVQQAVPVSLWPCCWSGQTRQWRQYS